MALNANSVLIYSANRGGRAVIRFLGSSANVIVVGNSTVNADITDTTQLYANDQIKAAHVSGAWWSLIGNSTVMGTVAVARVVNTTLTSNIMVLSGTGYFSRDNEWSSDRQNQTANILVTFTTGTVGTLYLELTKQYEAGDQLIDHK